MSGRRAIKVADARTGPATGAGAGGNHPVINVSWEDAQEYLRWLSKKTGKPYRLPSEAEWEYAARGGTTGPFHFGSTILPEQANYDGRSAYSSGRKGLFRGRTVPVGSFSSNAYGLHDVHGNVWEWVEDCWHRNYREAPSDARRVDSRGGLQQSRVAWRLVGPRTDERAFRETLQARQRNPLPCLRVSSREDVGLNLQ